jgi:hypothetical protein
MPQRSFASGGYRFGFNGQEKIDEISGNGNHNTAMFWEYDTRVIHRWNMDPKNHESWSPFSIMQGNPIFYKDILGDTVEIAGEAEVGPPTEFAWQTRQEINSIISQSPAAAQMYNDLHSSEFVYQIAHTSGNSKFFPGDVRKNTTSELNKETQSYAKSGGKILFNPKCEGVFEQKPHSNLSQRVSRPGITLFHELSHGDDARQGLLRTDKITFKGLNVNEWSATHKENIIRGEMLFPLRTYYTISIFDGKTEPSPTKLITPTSDGLFKSRNPNFNGTY